MANSQKKIDNSVVGRRSNHDMSFNWLGTSDFGRLVPFHVEELIGTDKVITCKPKIEIQMLPLASPTFGKMDLYVHYFFVPTRLLWDDFNDFYSQSGAGASSVPPYWTVSDFVSTYGAYDQATQRAFYKHWTSFGLPDFFTVNAYASSNSRIKDDRISLLPFRAYNQIWWDFYRDPELIPDSNRSFYLHTHSGNDQEQTIVYIPRMRLIQDTWLAHLFSSNGLISPTGLALGSSVNPALVSASSYKNLLAGYGKVLQDGSANVANNLIAETNSKELRLMEALTRMSERLSLGGKRQIDRLFAQYGIKPEFSILNMCQYIGGAKASVLVSDITSSADTQGLDGSVGIAGAPLGMKAGAGYCAFNNLNINFTAHEPGYLMGIFSVMPHVHFKQALSKNWYRNNLNDWYRSELEHVGQVAVPKKEVALNGITTPEEYDLSGDTNTFGFTQPYYDYKRHIDVLAGDFSKYFNVEPDADIGQQDVAYMNSMGLYVPYAQDRNFSQSNLSVSSNANKVFFYLGGEMWQDVDDHFHINCDVNCVINRPMDGYAIPSVETTEDPHAKKSDVGSDVVL